METVYVNAISKPKKSNISTSPTGPTSSERRRHGAVVLSLSLLSVFLLAGLIGLRVHYHGLAAELSSVKANRSLSQLNSTLIEFTKERDELPNLSELKKTCPSGWTMSSGSCYLLSTESGSWDKGRQDCRGRGADLVVTDSPEEQTFLTRLTSDEIWIGLTDREEEGVWKWVDGTPLTLSYWGTNQPDNGDEVFREENCAHIWSGGERNWNDVRCYRSLRWICEKKAV